MKDPGKINNDSGWCQDEPPNYVGPGGGGGRGDNNLPIINNLQFSFFFIEK